MKSTDIRIRDVHYSYQDFLYRTPIKFGGVRLDRATLLDVQIDVETRSGKTKTGYGSMPMGNVWSYPSKKMSYAETLAAMKVVVEQVCRITRDFPEFSHPIDVTWELEHTYFKVAEELSISFADPIPTLATLVCASPFDAALHDAYGKVHERNCYQTYSSDWMNHDLSHYLGEPFRGQYLDSYVLQQPKFEMPLYHLVGALDPLADADVQQPINDGLPETLQQWIAYNGLTHFKIKLNGDDLNWDLDRILQVDSICAEEQTKRGVLAWFYSLDFNERCAHVAYLLELLRKIQELRPNGFDRIQYIEQPTKRDLKSDRNNTMHDAAKLRPVVIDESLIDLQSLYLAKEMGYTGAALKACKGQTQSLLMAAAAIQEQMFLCVQDLTCPGASLIHSAGLAAHIPGIAAIEANARQYFPAANAPWQDRFPGLFHITDGRMKTGQLHGPGLSAYC